MQIKPPVNNPRITRSASLATNSNSSPNQHNGANTIIIKPRKGEHTQGQPTEAISTTIRLLQPIAAAINKAIAGETSTKQLMDEVITYIKEAEKDERADKQKPSEQAEANALRQMFRQDLTVLQLDLAERISAIADTANSTRETAEKTLKTAEELKGGTNDLICKVGNVTSVADKIANATQSYRDVLVARQAPAYKASVDPKVLGDMERKAKQILMDIFDKEGANTMERSLAEHVDKANEVISKMIDSEKPVNAKVESASITRNRAILLTLDSKETVNWIREPANEMVFADAFAKGAHIRDREYSLIVPRIPLTFEPDNVTHLREIEEVNRLPSRILRKARWIKPIGRRRPGQAHAYAILSISSVDTANKLIKDGIVICGNLTRPTKQKQEPSQCMKCRRWGHFAAHCPDVEDTCGTCGGKHRTNNCGSKEKLHCVSCGVNSHASWDRTCPDFIKRCALMDERNPHNSMPFFPTDQDWTLVTRPSRIPMEERFPASYAVNSLPYATAKPSGATSQRKVMPSHVAKGQRVNPNRIPLPAKTIHTPKEAGELTDQEGTSNWQREPVNQNMQKYNEKGEYIPSEF
jgi:hypothetical protein